MSRKNSLTLRRGITTVIVEGCCAITCLTVMAVGYLLLAPLRGISRLTQFFRPACSRTTMISSSSMSLRHISAFSVAKRDAPFARNLGLIELLTL
ncbi:MULTISPECIES: hypothetical protein [Bradyrhizobium]|uniref:hypothetical protein n=1 Tax=Bradyrhizobium pachyrhizi TaxID=280333 RepID=UPI002AA5A842